MAFVCKPEKKRGDKIFTAGNDLVLFDRGWFENELKREAQFHVFVS